MCDTRARSNWLLEREFGPALESEFELGLSCDAASASLSSTALKCFFRPSLAPTEEANEILLELGPSRDGHS